MDRTAIYQMDGSCSGVRLIAAPPAARRAAGAVASLLDLPILQVTELLATAPCILPVPADADMNRLHLMLRALGLQVELTEVAGPGPAQDICVKPAPGADAAELVPAVAHVAGLDFDVAKAGLTHRDGLLIEDLGGDVADTLHRKLRRIRHLTVARSCRQTALYDLFCDDAAPCQRMAAHLRLLGHGEDPVTGAKAAGFNRTIRDHLLRVFPRARLIDRAFQRFDLFLVHVDRRVGGDMADFLTARTGLPRDRFGLVTADAPVRLEQSLSRVGAIRFRADYEAIGFQTVLRLSCASAETQPAARIA